MSARIGPGYWMYETSGILRPAIAAYVNWALDPKSPEMTEPQIAAMRAYLRQWIACPMWQGEEIEALRDSVDWLTSRAAFDQWIDKAMDQGIDPL